MGMLIGTALIVAGAAVGAIWIAVDGERVLRRSSVRSRRARARRGRRR